MTSCWSPYSALSLVRQRIHALRQSTELFEEAHILDVRVDSGHRFHRYAWFNSGYMHWRLRSFFLNFCAVLGLTVDTYVALVVVLAVAWCLPVCWLR